MWFHEMYWIAHMSSAVRTGWREKLLSSSRDSVVDEKFWNLKSSGVSEIVTIWERRSWSSLAYSMSQLELIFISKAKSSLVIVAQCLSSSQDSVTKHKQPCKNTHEIWQASLSWPSHVGGAIYQNVNRVRNWTEKSLGTQLISAAEAPDYNQWATWFTESKLLTCSYEYIKRWVVGARNSEIIWKTSRPRRW